MKKSIQSLSDRELLVETESLSMEERRITSLLIEHLREVNRRKLFSDLGYPSLFIYCLKALKMSEASAQRRIDALRLTETHPEVKQKIENGEISLSVASYLQTFIRQEGKMAELTVEKKKELIESVQGLSRRDAERELLKHSVAPVRHLPEKTQVVGPSTTQIQFTATEEQMRLFEKVRGLLAHTDSHLSWAELFEKMARLSIQKIEPLSKRCRSVSPPRSSDSRVPGAGLRREVLRRDGGKCTQCGSQYALEVDHRVPWALGGETKSENLRVLCRNCNQRAAIRAFGLKKVESHT